MDTQSIDITGKKPTKRKPRGRKIRPREKPKKDVIIETRPGRKIGYMRVSTEKQDMALQIEALFDAGIEWDDIYADTITGSKITRKGLNECLKFLVRGDTLCVWKLDRFSRSLRDLLNQLFELEGRGISLVSLTQNFDTSTPMGRLMVQIIGGFAEFEREMIRERVTAGIRAKLENGNVRWGKQPAVDYDPEEVRKLLRQKMPQRQIAKTIGISKSTVSNINKAMKEGKKCSSTPKT